MGAAVTAGIAVAGAAVVSFLTDAAKAAMEDERSQKLLALALENTTGATEAEIASTEAYIDTLARASGVADDELRPALAELVRTHGSVEDAEKALTVAMDIAAAKGIELETVTRALGKASLGNVGALGRMGIATKNAKGEMLTYEEVLTEATRTMGGAMEEAANTTEGSMRRAQVAWDEAKEGIGRSLLPALTDVANAAVAFQEDWANMSAGVSGAAHDFREAAGFSHDLWKEIEQTSAESNEAQIGDRFTVRRHGHSPSCCNRLPGRGRTVQRCSLGTAQRDQRAHRSALRPDRS